MKFPHWTRSQWLGQQDPTKVHGNGQVRLVWPRIAGTGYPATLQGVAQSAAAGRHPMGGHVRLAQAFGPMEDQDAARGTRHRIFIDAQPGAGAGARGPACHSPGGWRGRLWLELALLRGSNGNSHPTTCHPRIAAATFPAVTILILGLSFARRRMSSRASVRSAIWHEANA